MISLFRYNWVVREEYFEIFSKISTEELMYKRVGGVGSILATLIHIIDVEYSWILGLQGKQDIELNFDQYKTIEQVKTLSETLHSEISEYLKHWSSEMENETITVSWIDGEFTKGEVLRHLIAHEIHHVGQLSVWAREIGIQPGNANFIERGLF